jgi:hypothetical protein
MEHSCDDAFHETIFEMFTRRIAPTATPSGPRIRDPKRKKIG